MVGVSYMTEEPDEEKIKGLTFATTTEEQRRATRESWNKWDVIASLVVIIIIIAAYLYFRG